MLKLNAPRQLALNAVFVVWAMHVLVTGDLVPAKLVALFQDPAPIVAVTEPDHKPAPPVLDVSLPET